MSNSAALNKLNDATAAGQTATVDKGKGKGPAVVDDESSSDEEMIGEVCSLFVFFLGGGFPLAPSLGAID
jgi:hypothetical protein